jgi:16S rRNA (guanine527-N7)-methyltransferase
LSEARLRKLVELVTVWSAKINLVSKNDLPHLWERHVRDSLGLVAHIPAGTEGAIDLGSGAGFPGLVLAIAAGIPFTLIESDARKAAFLLEAARQTLAPVKVINARIEAAKTAPAMLVTARALAPLDKLLGLAAPHLAPGGVCLFPKGRNVEEELAQARTLWRMDVEQYKTAAGEGACILKVSNIRHAGPTTTRRRDL